MISITVVYTPFQHSIINDILYLLVLNIVLYSNFIIMEFVLVGNKILIDWFMYLALYFILT